MIKTKIFSDADLEDALDEFESYCEDAKLDIDNIISVTPICRHVDKESSVVLVYDDLDDD